MHTKTNYKFETEQKAAEFADLHRGVVDVYVYGPFFTDTAKTYREAMGNAADPNYVGEQFWEVQVEKYS